MKKASARDVKDQVGSTVFRTKEVIKIKIDLSNVKCGPRKSEDPYKNSLWTHSRTHSCCMKAVRLTHSFTRSRFSRSIRNCWSSTHATAQRLREATRSLQVRTFQISLSRLMRLRGSFKNDTNKVLLFAHRSPIAWRVTGGAPKVKAGNLKFSALRECYRSEQTQGSAVPVIACFARLSDDIAAIKETILPNKYPTEVYIVGCPFQ